MLFRSEAMASGATIVASDLPAFRSVLGDGKYGKLFSVGDKSELAQSVIGLLSNDASRQSLGASALDGAHRFDWSEVGPQVMNVYLHAIGSGEKVTVGNEGRVLGRLLRGEGDE